MKDVRGAHLFWMDGVWANVHKFQLCWMQKKVLMFGTAHVPVVDVVQFYAYLLECDCLPVCKQRVFCVGQSSAHLEDFGLCVQGGRNAGD
jgi:hypothetical protein